MLSGFVAMRNRYVLLRWQRGLLDHVGIREYTTSIFPSLSRFLKIVVVKNGSNSLQV